jgi:hypothetical protein
MGHKPGAEVKLLLIGGIIGLVMGVALTVFYFSLATFFAVQAKAAQKKGREWQRHHRQRKAGDRRKAS